MQYFVYSKTGERFGPATVQDLNEWAKDGRVDINSMVAAMDTEEVIPITKVPGFQIAPPVPKSNTTYQPQPTKPASVFVENNLVQAILVTMCCCLPFGIVSIVYASQVDGFARSGDRVAAEDAADKAQSWANWGFGVGLFWIVLYLLVMTAARGQRNSRQILQNYSPPSFESSPR